MTKSGLEVKAKLDKRQYPLRVKVSDENMKSLNIEPHRFHGEWNYTIKPRKTKRILNAVFPGLAVAFCRAAFTAALSAREPIQLRELWPPRGGAGHRCRPGPTVCQSARLPWIFKYRVSAACVRACVGRCRGAVIFQGVCSCLRSQYRAGAPP